MLGITATWEAYLTACVIRNSDGPECLPICPGPKIWAVLFPAPLAFVDPCLHPLIDYFK